MRTADYVIVGVGTAGAVLAKKLTDDKKTSVIALHNGENLTEEPLIKFSRNAVLTVLSALIGPPFYDKEESTIQAHANLRKLEWVLSLPEGGASSVNVGAWCRGSDEFYARWAEIAGPEWSPEKVLEIYKSLENYTGTSANPIFRGDRGPVDVRQVPNPSPLAIKFTNAVHEATGVPIVEDYNDPTTPLCTCPQFQYTQKGCRGELRVSSATAFLNENVMTPNGRGVNGRKLRVLFEATGLKTLWEGTKAVGVEYVQNGKKKTVFANKGVIVCAGMNSSAFLMHSGVGPKEILEDLKIEVVFNNQNVGKGLVDQWMVPMLFSSNPLDSRREPTNPFLQISWLPAPDGSSDNRTLRLATINAIPGLTAALFDLIQPKSRGTIAITSQDPEVPPVVDFEVLSNPQDLATYVQGFQTYIKKINEALQAQDPSYQLLLPDPEIIDDTPALEDYIREIIRSNQSFQGHCQMGTVVDSQGRVFGVENLYVADDSVVPLSGMDGSTMATAFLVAANVARLIQSQP